MITSAYQKMTFGHQQSSFESQLIQLEDQRHH